MILQKTAVIFYCHSVSWLAAAMDSKLSFEERCRIYISRFKFGLTAEGGNLRRRRYNMKRYSACLEVSRNSLPILNSIVLGKHYPLILSTTGTRLSVIAANDYVVGAFVRFFGTYDPIEESILRYMTRQMNSDGIIIEAGANIGAYTIPIAETLMESQKYSEVHCFEPFRMMFQILTANIVLNGLRNVHTYQLALGDTSRKVTVQSPSYTKHGNLGAMRVEFQQKEEVAFVSYEGEEEIEVTTIDELFLSNRKRVLLIKIDVEGMELKVVKGARSIIIRDRPIIYAENQLFFWEDDRRFVNFIVELDIGYECYAEKELSEHNIIICNPNS